MSTLVVYAGTFDPITLGHLDIIERASKIFDEVIVAIADIDKPGLMLPIEVRLDLVRRSLQSLPYKVETDVFSGLLVDYVRARKSKIIIRGLRAISDYEFEGRMAMANRQLAEEIETVFLVTSENYSFVSSSMVKEIAQHKGDFRFLVPDCVVPVMQEYFADSQED